MTTNFKNLICACFFLALTNPIFSQHPDEVSDLRLKVDSIIRHEIGYVVDSSTNFMPKRVWDPTIHRGMYPSFPSLPSNPMTLLILDGEPVTISELDKYRLEDIARLKFYPKNDEIVTAIYGESGKNGLVIIGTKK